MVQFVSVSPVQLVADVFETAEYYRDVLGFHFGQIYGEPPSFVIVQRDSARLMFRQARDRAPPPANSRSLSEYSRSSILRRIRFREGRHQESNFPLLASKRTQMRIPFPETRRFANTRTGS